MFNDQRNFKETRLVWVLLSYITTANEINEQKSNYLQLNKHVDFG